jgi:monovalent cation/proton antiporter MnhG/PhaG subunit
MARVSLATVASSVLLWLGVGLELLCCAGVVVMRGVYSRLHFTAPAGLGAIAIALAVLVHQGFSLIGDKALLVAFVVLISAPVISHATARAAWIRAGEDEPEP